MAPPLELSTLELVKPDQFQQSYTRLFMAFTLSEYGISKAIFNSAVAAATIDNVTIAQLDARSNSLSSNLAAIRANTKDVLDKLDAAFNSPNKAQAYDVSTRKNDYDNLMRNARPVIEASEDLDKSEDLFRKNFKLEREKVLASLEHILKAIESANDPDARAHSQEIVNELSKVRKTCVALTNSFNKLEKSRQASNIRLQITHKDAYGLLSESDKRTVVPPSSRPGELPPTPSAPAA